MKKTAISTAWIILPVLLLTLMSCGSGNDSGVQAQQQQQGVATQQQPGTGVQQGDGGKQAVKSYYDNEKKRRDRVNRGLERRKAAMQREQQNTNSGKQSN